MDSEKINLIVNTLIEAEKKWGREKQLMVAQEELAELIVEISHKLRGRENEEQFMNEVVDVYLVMIYLVMVIGGQEKLIEKITEKVNRLKERIEK